jgi:hypothetical protein
VPAREVGVKGQDRYAKHNVAELDEQDEIDEWALLEALHKDYC